MASITNTTHSQSLPRFGSAKFSLPPRPRDLLPRPRLLNFLHEHIHYKLNLACAAAGYGKSSLLIDFAHDTDNPVAWCRLDESDADWVVLVSDLLMAIRSAFPGFQSMLPQLIGQTEPADLAKVLIREIETNIDQYFILVMDDFHLVQSSPEVIRFVDALLANLPEQAHLIISGRALPPLKMTALVARQQVAGLSEEHLRFTAGEVQALVQLRNGVSIPEIEAEKIAVSAEGWITGILLTAHLMWQGPIANLMRARTAEIPLYEYLADEVLNEQPELFRQFLMESAVLPEMEPSVCDAVLGRLDSADLLQQAETRRLFVSVVGNEFLTYQYHHLFRDFLIAKLNDRNPERLKELRRRAANWYADNAMPEAAVTFNVLAGDLIQAGTIAEANAAKMFSSGRYSTLQRWAEQLVAIQLEIPWVHLYLSTSETDLGEVDAAERHLSIASEGFLQREDQSGYIGTINQRSWLAYNRGLVEQALSLAEQARSLAREQNLTLPLALALRYAGAYEFVLGHLAQAEELLTQSIQLHRSISYQFNLAVTLNDLAEIIQARGQMTRAVQIQSEALEIWRQRGAPGPLAVALHHIAQGMHMLGQYQSALATYVEALNWAERSGNPRWEAIVLVGQGDLLADLGDVQSALDLFRQAMLKAEQCHDRNILVSLYRSMARSERWLHNFTAALKWVSAAETESLQASEVVKLDLAGLHGTLLVEIGSRAKGRKMLESACAALERADRPADLAQTLLFRGYAEFCDGDQPAAIVSLDRSFHLADSLGYEQMLLSEALSVREMLVVLASNTRIGRRVTELLLHAEAARSSQKHIQPVTTAPRSNEHIALAVRALGQSQVEKNDVEIPRTAWASQKTRELFVFLIDRSPIARDEVLAVFWPDMTTSRAVSNLHQTLYRLRRAVDNNLIVTDDLVCRISANIDLQYDVAHFEERAKAALGLRPHDPRRVELLASAANLYTGDYLADLNADWAVPRREGLSTLHIQVLREYADELMALTRYSEARSVLVEALAVEPFQDELHERMLICLGEIGQRHEVVN